MDSSHQGSVQDSPADIRKETGTGLEQAPWAKSSQPILFANNHQLEHGRSHSLVDYLWLLSSSAATDHLAFEIFSEKVGKCWARTQFQILIFIELSAKGSPPTWRHLICTMLKMLIISVKVSLGVLQSRSRDSY